MADLTHRTLRNRYFLRALIGSGGMADVYQAWDNLRATNMAIKVLRKDLALSSQHNRLFEQEAGLLRKLEHPNIVRIYEFDREGDIIFIVMDWVEGTTLRNAINDRKQPFTLEEVSFILLPVCAALNYAHQNMVYHCDVKPANILLHIDRRVLLSDFGVARLTNTANTGGTPPFKAPEQFSGGAVSAATDIYALGITIYQMLTGIVPFRGETQNAQGSTQEDKIAWEHLYATPIPLRQVNPAVPGAVESLVNRALSKDPRDRYPSVLSLRDAFEVARMGQGGGQAPSFFTTARDAMTSFSPSPHPPVQQPVSKPPPPIAQPAPPPAPQPASPPSSTPPRGPHLMGRTGDYVGQYFPILKGDMTIGRGSDMQVRLQEGSVSRVHAHLIRTRHGVYIQDDNSSVGTFLNGIRLQPGIPEALKSGDVIQFGHYLIFEFRS